MPASLVLIHQLASSCTSSRGHMMLLARIPIKKCFQIRLSLIHREMLRVAVDSLWSRGDSLWDQSYEIQSSFTRQGSGGRD